MTKKMTGWFKSGTKPVRSGVYETNHGYQYFSVVTRAWGTYWSIPVGTYGPSCHDEESLYQRPRWRGFTTKQKG